MNKVTKIKATNSLGLPKVFCYHSLQSLLILIPYGLLKKKLILLYLAVVQRIMNILFLSGHLVKLYYNYCCSRFYYEKYILDLWTYWAFLPRQWNHPRSLVMLQCQSYLLLMLTGQTISVCIEVNKMPLRSKSSALLFWYVKIFKSQKWLLTNLSEDSTLSEGWFILVCSAESPVNCETLPFKSGFSMWVMLL